jgi:large conductance mechanosensitive channel
MLKEFKEFVTRGNLVELAVAFIIGVAFASVVTAFTDVVLGAIAWVFGGEVSFDRLGVHRGASPDIVIPYGAFLTAVVNFLLIAVVLFLFVRSYNRYRRRQEETSSTRPCPFCTTDVAKEATRCPACTSNLEPVPA